MVTHYSFYLAAGACVIRLLTPPGGCAQAAVPLTFDHAETIPAFQIHDRPARIHTQGLCVTDDSYYITGRLDTEPRQPLLLKIDRATRKHVEFLNLAAAENLASDLDHPSGFDFDGHAFWIALSASKPKSRSIILRVPYAPEKPLGNWQSERIFEVQDHVGALAVEKSRIYGANWDTKSVYIWEKNGHLVRLLSPPETRANPTNWLPAVQDWKSISPGRILVGGLDKQLNPARSVLQIWELDPPKQLQSIVVEPPPGVAGELANEGCAFLGGQIFFLPHDLGPEAAIYIFRFPLPLGPPKGD